MVCAQPLEAERCTHKYDGRTDNLQGEAFGPPYSSTYDNASNPFASAAPGPACDTQYTSAADYLPTFVNPERPLIDAVPNPDNNTQYTSAADYLPTFADSNGLFPNTTSQYGF